MRSVRALAFRRHCQMSLMRSPVADAASFYGFGSRSLLEHDWASGRLGGIAVQGVSLFGRGIQVSSARGSPGQVHRARWPLRGAGYGTCLYLSRDAAGSDLGNWLVFAHSSPPMRPPWPSVKQSPLGGPSCIGPTLWIRHMRGCPPFGDSGRRGSGDSVAAALRTDMKSPVAPSNYAFERPVLRGQAAPRALRQFAPAALVQATCPAAQRGR